MAASARCRERHGRRLPRGQGRFPLPAQLVHQREPSLRDGQGADLTAALMPVGKLAEQRHGLGVFRAHLRAPGQLADNGRPGAILPVRGPVFQHGPQRPGGVAIRVHRAVRVRGRDEGLAGGLEVPGRELMHGDQGRHRAVGGQRAGQLPVQVAPP
jgi:hypothetical protein